MQKTKRITGAILSALLLALLLSCAKRPAVKPPVADLPAVEGPVTIQRLIDSLLYSKVRSIRSEVSITAKKDGDTKGRFMGALVYVSPGSIRLRAYDPFGETVMDMVKSGSMMQVYLPQSYALYEGWTPPLGLPPDALFGMEETVDTCILYVFRPGREDKGPQAMELASKHFFQRRTLLNTGMVIFAGGKRFMEIRLGDHSGHVPGSMEFTFFNGFTLSMSLNEPSIDSDLSPTLFSPIPHGTKHVQSIKALFRDFKL
jgi:hypothetical protein